MYNHGVEQLVRARDAMRAIGAVAAVPLFERAIAICNHADKELEVYRRGSYFDDPAPIGERLRELDRPYFDLAPSVSHIVIDYVCAQNGPWYDKAAHKVADDPRLELQSCLREAIASNHLEAVRRALEASGGKVTTSAMVLDQVVNDEIAALLLSHARADAVGRDGTPLIHVAAARGEKLVHALLARGADPRAPDSRWHNAPLHRARDAAVARTLLAAGGDARARNKLGQEPIHHARSREHVDVLLAAGADVCARTDEGRTVLHRMRSNPATLVRYLVELGADPNAVDALGQTPLHEIDAEFIDVLVDLGADVDARDRLGRTPLMTNADAPAIEALLARGARIDAVDNEGRGVLHFARFTPGAAEILVAARARLDVRDRTGRTPLERARWNLWRMECAGDEQGANDTLTKSGDYVFDHAWTDVLERLGR